MKLLTPEAVAEYIGISKYTLADWRVRKCGPAYILVGRLPRYSAEDVEHWLESRRKATSEKDGIKRKEPEVALPVQNRRKDVQREHRFGGHRTQQERRAANRNEGAGAGGRWRSGTDSGETVQ